MRHALINSEDGSVWSVIVWDGSNGWQPMSGYFTVLLDPGEIAGPGFTYDPLATPRFFRPSDE